MAHYNPNTPQILGQEWAPIRSETVTFGQQEASTEWGSFLDLTAAATAATVRFTVPWTHPTRNTFGYAGTQANIYQRGAETSTGPVRRVLIPVNNGSVTGSNASFTGGTAAKALWSPDDEYGVNIGISTSGVNAFTAYFDTNRYSQLLQGKRILAVNLLISADADISALTEIFSFLAVYGYINHLYTFSEFVASTSTGITNNGFDINTTTATGFTRFIGRIPLGTVNPLFNTGTVSISSTEAPSWTYADLQRFEISASGRYEVGFWSSTATPIDSVVAATSFMVFRYLSLEVLYCEENRVATGTMFLWGLAPLQQDGWVIGQNAVVMRHPVTRSVNPTLDPGAYTVTLTRPMVSAYGDSAWDPLYNVAGCRQLYPIPTVEGSVIRMPFPLDDSAEGKVPEWETSDFVPQLSVHSTTAVQVDCHPYGESVAAQVYGSIIPAQLIDDGEAGGANLYDQVRFIARRFGDTTVPLLINSTALPSSYAQITSAEFDILPTIIDGWKEVTLNLSAPASMGAGSNPDWRWSATGEYAGNRWEVLGASAPALSGFPGNLLNLSPQQLGVATYGTPPAGGHNYNLSWINGTSPMVSAVAADQGTDAFIIFSKNPPMVSGLSVSQPSQELVHVDSFCDTTPDCVPTGMTYNRVSWNRLNAAAYDEFNRVEVATWGTSDSGLPWTSFNGASAAEFSVNGSTALITTATAARRFCVLTAGGPDQDVKFLFRPDSNPTAGVFTFGTVLRYSPNNLYYSDVVADFSTTRIMSIRIGKFVAGVESLLVSAPVPMVMGKLSGFWIRSRASGPYVFSKVWPEGQDEPETWSIYANDTSLTSGDGAGVTMATDLGVQPFTGYFEHFSVAPSAFGALEMQRFDNVDQDWSTIMLGTNPAVTGFSDYEARVGMPSVYRMRQRNVYDFAGLWTAPVSGTITSPGVTNADTALLLFTSNSNQDGDYNLAYSSSWESDPEEEFAWPEGSSVTLRPMYAKDYVTAFRPLERGGERFGRTMLVNAAGIPAAVSLNGFRSLRDMAWADLPYVCVRDELGNRWYSAVMVPGGTRRRMVNTGMLQFAEVNIAEVSTAPYPVDP